MKRRVPTWKTVDAIAWRRAGRWPGLVRQGCQRAAYQQDLGRRVGEQRLALVRRMRGGRLRRRRGVRHGGVPQVAVERFATQDRRSMPAVVPQAVQRETRQQHGNQRHRQRQHEQQHLRERRQVQQAGARPGHRGHGQADADAAPSPAALVDVIARRYAPALPRVQPGKMAQSRRSAFEHADAHRRGLLLQPPKRADIGLVLEGGVDRLAVDPEMDVAADERHRKPDPVDAAFDHCGHRVRALGHACWRAATHAADAGKASAYRSA